MPEQWEAADRAGHERLTVSVESFEDGVLIRPAGDLDHDSADLLGDALGSAMSTAPPVVVIDVSRLAFCDSTGLNLLLRARLSAEEAGGRVVLAAPTPTVARLLDITGTRELFEVYATPELAVEAQLSR